MKKFLILFVLILGLSAQTWDFDKIHQAGEDLKASRSYFWVSLACYTIGTTLMLLGEPYDESSGGLFQGDFKYNAGIMINVAGFVSTILAWQKIGDAGAKLATAEK